MADQSTSEAYRRTRARELPAQGDLHEDPAEAYALATQVEAFDVLFRQHARLANLTLAAIARVATRFEEQLDLMFEMLRARERLIRELVAEIVGWGTSLGEPWAYPPREAAVVESRAGLSADEASPDPTPGGRAGRPCTDLSGSFGPARTHQDTSGSRGTPIFPSSSAPRPQSAPWLETCPCTAGVRTPPQAPGGGLFDDETVPLPAGCGRQYSRTVPETGGEDDEGNPGMLRDGGALLSASAAQAQCVLDATTGPPPTPLGLVIDTCPDPSIVVLSPYLPALPCSAIIEGGSITSATFKQVTISAPGPATVCVVTPSGLPAAPGLSVTGTASDITFLGNFQFEGTAGKAGLLIEAGTGHLFAGNARLPDYFQGASGGTGPGVEVLGSAQATLRAVFVDNSAVGVSAAGSSQVTLEHGVLAENALAGQVAGTATLTLTRLGEEPSQVVSNDDGLVAKDNATLSVNHTIFHHNFTIVPPSTVRRLTRVEGAAQAGWSNVNAHANGDPANPTSHALDVVEDARGRMIASTATGNWFESIVNFDPAVGSGTASAEVWDSILDPSAANGPISCSAPMGGSNSITDFTGPIPGCAPAMAVTPMAFTTGGLANTAVFTTHTLHLWDSNQLLTLEDQGAVPASILFPVGDWTVFDTPIREESCSVNDLGYHNHCATCPPTACP